MGNVDPILANVVMVTPMETIDLASDNWIGGCHPHHEPECPCT